jgi:hypothetical protein
MNYDNLLLSPPRELFEKIWFPNVKTIFIGIAYLNNAHESASRDSSKNSTASCKDKYCT